MVYVHELMSSPGTAKESQAARVFPAGKKFSHMIADTEEELVWFALLIGMKKAWLQEAGTYRAHFDLTERRCAYALKQANVKLLTKREFAVLLQRRREIQNEQPKTTDSGPTSSSS